MLTDHGRFSGAPGLGNAAGSWPGAESSKNDMPESRPDSGAEPPTLPISFSAKMWRENGRARGRSACARSRPARRFCFACAAPALAGDSAARGARRRHRIEVGHHVITGDETMLHIARDNRLGFVELMGGQSRRRSLAARRRHRGRRARHARPARRAAPRHRHQPHCNAPLSVFQSWRRRRHLADRHRPRGRHDAARRDARDAEGVEPGLVSARKHP